MNYLSLVFVVLNTLLSVVICDKCNVTCPPGEGEMRCVLDMNRRNYTLFPSQCHVNAYTHCHNVVFLRTPLKFCIDNMISKTRRMYGESCPVFCPNHYRPVCGMSTMRTYVYKTFNNGCFLDMLNCRGDEMNDYVEVPLSFCQRHLMKNIFKEQVVISGLRDYGV